MKRPFEPSKKAYNSCQHEWQKDSDSPSQTYQAGHAEPVVRIEPLRLEEAGRGIPHPREDAEADPDRRHHREGDRDALRRSTCARHGARQDRGRMSLIVKTDVKSGCGGLAARRQGRANGMLPEGAAWRTSGSSPFLAPCGH
jgi:hypothetical protein